MIINHKRSADAEGLCNVPQIRNIAHEKAFNRTLKIITIAAIR